MRRLCPALCSSEPPARTALFAHKGRGAAGRPQPGAHPVPRQLRLRNGLLGARSPLAAALSSAGRRCLPLLTPGRMRRRASSGRRARGASPTSTSWTCRSRAWPRWSAAWCGCLRAAETASPFSLASTPETGVDRPFAGRQCCLLCSEACGSLLLLKDAAQAEAA